MSAHSIGKLLITCICLLASVSALAASCADLSHRAIDTVTITETERREASTFEQRFGPDLALPAHCRVAAVLSPTDDSHIEMELWLPANWTGDRFAAGVKIPLLPT